jgi:hypothetical protein
VKSVTFRRWYTEDDKGYMTVEFIDGVVVRKTCNRYLESVREKAE